MIIIVLVLQTLVLMVMAASDQTEEKVITADEGEKFPD